MDPSIITVDLQREHDQGNILRLKTSGGIVSHVTVSWNHCSLKSHEAIGGGTVDRVDTRAPEP